MKNKFTDISKVKVDKAWDKLHDRLMDDGLISEDTQEVYTLQNNNQGKGPRFATVGIAASFMLVLVASVLIFRGIHKVDIQRELYVNDNSSSTFVKTLEDGSTIYLSQNSTLSVPKHFGMMRRETKLEGSAFFDVSKSKTRTFIIETKLAKIEVLGTSFNVTENTIAVRSGKVRVWSKESGATITLLAGESVEIVEGKLKPGLVNNIDSLYSGYIRNVHFKDEKLAVVIGVINKNLSKNTQSLSSIELEAGLENRLITASFDDVDALEYARLISAALNLKYDLKSETGKVLIYR